MITAALSRRTQELSAARIPYVTATVVRAQHPTSVEAGSVALVFGDGTIEGFAGGVCAEQSVRAYGLQALASGEPVLLRILPDAPGGDAEVDPVGAEVASEDGAVTVQNPCLSGGAIEVFLEPAPPVPRVLVVGDTPIAAAVRRIGSELGLEMVAAGGDMAAPAEGDLALVVAAHGRDELGALRRGLESALPYVGLVASDKRGSGVIAELRAGGVSEDLLGRIDVPAGIAIGSRTAGEIALSILAKIVSVRREAPTATSKAGHANGSTGVEAAGGGSRAGSMVVDPICGMTVAIVASTPSVRNGDETVYFCSEGCKAKFEADREHAVAD